MSQFVIKRVILLIPTFLGVITIVFLLMRLIPGDPAEFMLGDFATKEALVRLRTELGLTKPIYVQYVMFMKNVLSGNMGISLITKQSTLVEVMRSYPFSIQLAGFGMIVAILVGIPLGILSAIRQNSLTDFGSMTLALFGISTPVFLIGLVAILLFSYYIPLFPTTGLGNRGNPGSLLHHLALPGITLGISCAAYIARLTRSSMLEVIRQDYIRTARAKGLPEYVVVLKHALKNSIVPVIALVGLTFGWALSGSILIEVVFSRPGLGLLLIKAIFQRDYPLVQAGVAALALSFAVINLIVDLLIAYVDPRIRFS